MNTYLSAEDRSALIDAVYGPAGARPSDPDDACDAVIAACERIVAAAVVEERERIAHRMLNTVDPLLPGHEVRRACVEITRDES